MIGKHIPTKEQSKSSLNFFHPLPCYVKDLLYFLPPPPPAPLPCLLDLDTFSKTPSIPDLWVIQLLLNSIELLFIENFLSAVEFVKYLILSHQKFGMNRNLNEDDKNYFELLEFTIKNSVEWHNNLVEWQINNPVDCIILLNVPVE